MIGRRGAWVLVLSIVMSSGASAQISQSQIEALQEAVAAIAIRNHAVENLIYDGMTGSDVERVLDDPVVITVDVTRPIDFMFLSSHGNYVVFWSSKSRFNNPVVIGFQRRGDSDVRHNYVDDVDRR